MRSGVSPGISWYINMCLVYNWFLLDDLSPTPTKGVQKHGTPPPVKVVKIGVFGENHVPEPRYLNEMDRMYEQAATSRSLHLHWKELVDIPAAVYQITSLTELKLQSNKLEQLPLAIAELKSLKYLYLANNRLSEISEGIGLLKKLEVLSLEDNQIVSFPEKMTRMYRIRIIRLTNNK